MCPECGHEFRGNGWDGIDAHWRANHAHLMRYEDAWPLIATGEYKSKKKPCGNQAAAVVTEATEKD